MIVLDTNVISEFMTDNPNQMVLDWFDAQPTNNLDDYGIWTEWDQNSVAAEVFDLLDKTEN